MTVLNELKLV